MTNYTNDLRLYTDREALAKDNKKLKQKIRSLEKKLSDKESELGKAKKLNQKQRKTNKVLAQQNLRLRELVGEKPVPRTKQAEEAYRRNRDLTVNELCNKFFLSKITVYKLRMRVHKQDEE